jgi:hypothetical protein
MLLYPRERRPENSLYNAAVPTQAELDAYRAGNDSGWWTDPKYNRLVTGSQGARAARSTDELISWVACKWGIDENLIRAEAWQESTWRQTQLGDLCGGDYQSFGLLQIKSPFPSRGCPNGWVSVFPMIKGSTAFNLDFYASKLRGCYDGAVNWWVYPAGDIWGCVGWWFAGNWHSASGDNYAAQVRAHLANRPWEGL